MLAKLSKRVTRSGAATAGQWAGAAAVVVGVGLLTGVAWALIAGGVAALAFGVAAEVG